MDSRLLLVTDTHLGLYKSSDIWHNVVTNLFKEIVDKAVKSNIDTIIHLGDFFHERKVTNTKTLSVAREIEDILKPVKMFIITGNHDIYYKNQLKPSSLQIFENSPNITIIYKTMIWSGKSKEEIYCLIPWGSELPSKEGYPYPYVFGHFDINGCYMNNKKTCDKGRYNLSDFSLFDKVYSGHFHTPSINGNIQYLGSPFQQTFHDVGNTTGYYIFNNGSLEFIEFTDYPKFTIIKSSDIIEKEMVEGNMVKLVFEENLGTNENMKIVERVQSFSPISFSVDFSSIPIEEDEETGDFEIETHSEILAEWIDRDKNAGTNIDKNLVKNLVNQMLEEGEYEDT